MTTVVDNQPVIVVARTIIPTPEPPPGAVTPPPAGNYTAQAPPIAVGVISQPARATDLTSKAPPVKIDIRTLPSVVSGATDRVSAPAIPVVVAALKPSSPRPPVDTPPVKAKVYVVPADLRRFRYGQIIPEDDVILPITTPTLSAYVNLFEGDVDDPGTVELDFEYGTLTSSNYALVTTVRQPVEIYTSYSSVDLTLPELTGSTYQWRVRLVVDGNTRPWSDYWQFTVGTTTQAAAIMPVTSMIVAAPTWPHLWVVEPPVAAPGETVTVIGHGFPLTPTSVLFGSDPVTVESWRHVPATGNATTTDRLIDGESVIDCEHDEIVIVVPDTEEAGAGITVQAGVD